jgi:hypothetical protein
MHRRYHTVLVALVQLHSVACLVQIPPQACRPSTVSPPRAATAAIDEVTAVADMEQMPMDVDYPGIRSASRCRYAPVVVFLSFLEDFVYPIAR